MSNADEERAHAREMSLAIGMKEIDRAWQSLSADLERMRDQRYELRLILRRAWVAMGGDPNAELDIIRADIERTARLLRDRAEASDPPPRFGRGGW